MFHSFNLPYPILGLPNNYLSNIRTVDVKNHGAVGDGTVLETIAVQELINFTALLGGGIIKFTTGIYKIGCLTGKSNVYLYIASDAIIMASTDQSDYAQSNKPLIDFESCTNCGVYGPGIINGGATTFYFDGNLIAGNRPNNTVSFRNCKGVYYKDTTIRDSTGWSLVMSGCTRLFGRGYKCKNRSSDFGYVNDGIDLVNCSYGVFIDCTIYTGDDGLCVKTMLDTNYTNSPRSSHDIIFQNCTIYSCANGIRIGSETSRDIFNIIYRNIIILPYPTAYTQNSGFAGVSIGSSNGGDIDNVLLDGIWINCTEGARADGVDTALWVFGGMRSSSTFNVTGDSRVSGITFNNVHSVAKKSSQFNTENGYYLRRIAMTNCEMHTTAQATTATLPMKCDPANMFEPWRTLDHEDAMAKYKLPSYGVFARNVIGLSIDGSNHFYDDGNSGGAAIVLDNVS